MAGGSACRWGDWSAGAFLSVIRGSRTSGLGQPPQAAVGSSTLLAGLDTDSVARVRGGVIAVRCGSLPAFVTSYSAELCLASPSAACSGNAADVPGFTPHGDPAAATIAERIEAFLSDAIASRSAPS